MASPRIEIREKVFEALSAGAPGLTAVIIGTAEWGEIENIQLVNSLNRFNKLYGFQTSRSFLYFAAKKYLTNSSNLYVARAGVKSSTEQDKNAKKAIVEVKDVNDENVVLTIEAKYTGERGNRISVDFVYLGSQGDKNAYNVYVYENDYLVETFKNCAINVSETDPDYIENKINNSTTGSAYITVEVNPNLDDKTLHITNNEKKVSLAGGTNGDIETSDGKLVESINNILEKLKDKDKYVFDVIIVPDYSFNKDVELKLIELVDYRNDCVAIIDPPFGLGLAPSNQIDNVIKFHDGELNSTKLDNKNIAVFAYWQKDYDDIDKVYKWFPPSIYVASKLAWLENNFKRWYSVAGLNYGRLNTIDTEYSPSLDERDLLYGELPDGTINAINPIVKFQVEGITIWGQRTTERSNSPTSRLNTVMMLNYLKQRLYRIAKRLQFELNTPVLESRFTSEVEQVLSYIKANDGIDDYQIICDETTNTPEVKANFKFAAKVRVIPTTVAETIEITIEVTPQTVKIE